MEKNSRFSQSADHAYWGVDLLLVWDVIANELAPFKLEAERLLQQLKDQ